MQDTAFVNSAARALIWKHEGVVVAGNLTFNNVTTAAVRWDSAGRVVGSGSPVNVVLSSANETGPASPVAELEDLPGDSVHLLSDEDPWLVAVQQVCLQLHFTRRIS